MSFRADLHCHSTCSDGTFTPEELILHAAQLGLNALSITDHDTIEAYRFGVDIAKSSGIELITGVEFSTVLSGVSVHLLAYRFPLPNPDIEEFCLRHQIRRQKRNLEILLRLKQHGMPISEEELLDSVISSIPSGQKFSMGRPHIAQIMFKKGYVLSLQEAFKKYLGDGCCCYVQGEKVSPQETIELIHKAKGLAVIAHPHLINNSPILTQLLAMDFDGIECYYSKFPANNHTRWLKIAKQRNWLITGGSDFHGEIKPSTPLGCSWINEEELNKLKNR